MIDLAALADLAQRYGTPDATAVAPIRIGERTFDPSGPPVLMGTVNLSTDSTYRGSIAYSAAAAIRKVRTAAAQGADVVDLGAESTTAAAARVDDTRQVEQLVPVVSACSEDGIAVSVETYSPMVTRKCLEAGAVVLNMTGARHQDEMFELAAEFNATVVLCFSPGDDVRVVTDVVADDPMPGLLAHFEPRIARAHSLGATRLVIDPGMGFYYGNLTEPITRVQHQARVLLNAFRLQQLGLPVCQALPHALVLFEEQYPAAEGFFAVLASLGGAGMLRTHEVALTRSVSTAMATLDVAFAP